ncbi:MAG: hypothetical protein A2Z52_01395 [Candidatus Moranbacteria bacterium RBG_19FT_COMBO_42_6]|nr:MAG: hypothetical protein A2Z52_01395 [Candidatus Moranbacteria bacterium RBG_19FT_COMBO_42_6]
MNFRKISSRKQKVLQYITQLIRPPTKKIKAKKSPKKIKLRKRRMIKKIRTLLTKKMILRR